MCSQSLKLFACGSLCLVIQMTCVTAAFANPGAAKPTKPAAKPAPEVVSVVERQPGRGGLDLGWGDEGDEEDEPVQDRFPAEQRDDSKLLEEPKSDDFFNQLVEGNSKKEDL